MSLTRRMARVFALILIVLGVVVLIRAHEGHWGWVRGGYVEPARMAVVAWVWICVGLLIFLKPTRLSGRANKEPPKKQ